MSRASSNAAYGPTIFAGSASFTANGLNQYTTVGGQALQYNARGDLTADGTDGQNTTHEYDLLDRVQSAHGVGLTYDAYGRLASVGGSHFTYDGSDLIAEYDGSGNLVHRYVHGPGVDEPLVQYDGSGTKAWLLADEQGSIVGAADVGGATAATGFDDYGQGSPVSRFGFTGQAWLGEVGLYHFKARAYSPALGRFYQTDPAGDLAAASLYEYVRNDPINRSDPSGLTANFCFFQGSGGGGLDGDTVEVDGPRRVCADLTSIDKTPDLGSISNDNPFSVRAGRVAAPPPPTLPRNTSGCRAVNLGSTGQVGVAGQGTIGPISYQISLGVAFDSSGNIALYGATGPGVGVGGGGAAGLTIQTSNAPTVADLGGPFGNVSGGGGLVAGGTIDGSSGSARNGQRIVGGGVTAGAAAGETSFAGVTNTFLSPSLNLRGKPTC